MLYLLFLKIFNRRCGIALSYKTACKTILIKLLLFHDALSIFKQYLPTLSLIWFKIFLITVDVRTVSSIYCTALFGKGSALWMNILLNVFILGLFFRALFQDCWSPVCVLISSSIMSERVMKSRRFQMSLRSRGHGNNHALHLHNPSLTTIGTVRPFPYKVLKQKSLCLKSKILGIRKSYFEVLLKTRMLHDTFIQCNMNRSNH